MKKIAILFLFFIPLIGFGQNIFPDHFFENEKQEERIYYWENDQKLSEIQYLNGKREGSCKYWYSTGQLMNEGFYKNGKMTGPFISYYQNGQIESQGIFKYVESGSYSRKDGVWKYYYDNGQLESESIIKDGVEELKFYDKEGNLKPNGGGC
tara:strand:- start:83 stop:538 length:456 start_codon:yes stop_codon:yes gene_type:complete